MMAQVTRGRTSLARFGVNLVAPDYHEDASEPNGELGWEAKISTWEAVRPSLEWIRARQPQFVRG